MFERTVRRVVESGKAHRWLRPLGLLALLALFGGAALLRGAAGLAARTREAGGRGLAALGELRRDYIEQRARRKARESGARPVDLPRRPARRALAGALAACLLVTLLPVSALAVEGGEAVTVAAFEALDGAVAEQTVPFGTAREALNLPGTLRAAVCTTAPDTETVIMEGVTWEPDAPYEGAAGSYAFTASAAGYAPAQGVDWPVITVTVEEPPAPEPAPEPAPSAYDAALALFAALPGPEAVADMTDGEKDALSAQIGGALDALFALPDEDYKRFMAEHADYMENVQALQTALTGGAETMAGTPPPPTVDGTDILANGVEIKIVAGSTAGNTNILYDKDGGGTIGDTEYLQIGDTAPTAKGYNLGSYTIYGGSFNANVDGETKITMTGGKVNYIYGGGWATSADANVKGAELILSGGSVFNYVYGGGMASYASNKTASVEGNTSVTLSGDVDIGMSVFGGGYAAGNNTTAKVTGTAVVTMEGGKVGRDSSGIGIHGGGKGERGGISTVGSASVTMTGGSAVAVYGGGWASSSSSQDNVTGAATVSLSGNAEVSGGVYGGGYTANSGTSTAGSKTVTVGGGVKIGGGTAKGIVINSGTGSVTNGVDSFVIANDLTDNASVNVQLPAGYDVSSNPAIATVAVEADLAKIKLVGDGAEGNEAYFENNEIKVRAKAAAGPIPTVDVAKNIIFANGAEIKIVAGTTNGQPNTNTNILYDKDGNGTIGDKEYLKIGDTDPTDAGYGLGWYMIYGGGNNTSVTGDTKITMTGGDVGNIIGGSYGNNTTVTGSTSVTVTGGILSGIWAGSAGDNATVTGNTSVTVTGGIVAGALFGGGDGNNAMVTGSKTVTVGGGAKIGATAKNGIFINGGTGTPRVNGVDSFVIDPDLIGEDDSIYVTLPAGYDISSNPTIATNAVQGDLAKIKLVGDGAEGKEAYFEGNAIKVRAKIARGGVIKSDTAAETIAEYFGGAATVENKVITLTGEVKLTGAVTFESGNWILDLKNYNLDTSNANQIKAVAVTGGELTIRGTGGIIGSSLGQTMNADNFGQAVFISSGKLTVEDSVSLTGGKGTYIGTDAIRAQNAAVVIKGNASLTGGDGPVLGNGFGLQAENCTVTISGNPVITGSADQHGVFLTGGSIALSDTPIVKGGPGSLNSSIGLYITDGGTAAISGGTFIGDDNGLFVQGSTSSVTLSGGAYQGGRKAIAIESNTALTVASFLGQGCVYFINDRLVESSQIENKKFLGAANEKVTVKPATVPTITTSTLPGGAVGTAYSQTLAASGTTPITWSQESGNLPDGLTLNSDGAITGTPTVANTFTFTVKAENSAGNATKELSIVIAAPAPTVTSVAVTPATASVQKGNTQQFSAAVTGTNNPAQTVTWSIEDSHASGTGISNTGLLTVASDETQATLTVRAASTVDAAKSGTATVTVADTPVITYTITFDAGGGSVTPATAQTGADGKLASLPTPTRSGNYSFDYWQLSDGTRVTLDTVFDGDTTITARWTYTGSSSSSGSHTTTEKHPDGSITTTVTKPDGTKTETTKAPDGTKTVVETRKDGAKTETVETPDGTRAETVTTAQGDRTYTEQRPDGTKITADAPKSGEATATVALPESAGETVVSFPATDGTVVLRVLPDGAEEPVPFSLVKDGKVYVRLDGDAELKVETRAGLFDDMGGHWAEEFADFTGARALFEGTAPRNFAPEQTMTRAMLATVLYRMDGKPQVGQAAFDDVEAAAWYAPGAAWASEHGIAAGSGGAFDGGRAISRQELAVMLWNYARYDGLDVSADGDGPSYSDLDEAAEWAVPALNWASGMGILQGDKNGALDPTGTATRAEAAAMLERFVVAVVQ